MAPSYCRVASNFWPNNSRKIFFFKKKSVVWFVSRNVFHCRLLCKERLYCTALCMYACDSSRTTVWLLELVKTCTKMCENVHRNMHKKLQNMLKTHEIYENMLLFLQVLQVNSCNWVLFQIFSADFRHRMSVWSRHARCNYSHLLDFGLNEKPSITDFRLDAPTRVSLAAISTKINIQLSLTRWIGPAMETLPFPKWKFSNISLFSLWWHGVFDKWKCCHSNGINSWSRYLPIQPWSNCRDVNFSKK